MVGSPARLHSEGPGHTARSGESFERGRHVSPHAVPVQPPLRQDSPDPRQGHCPPPRTSRPQEEEERGDGRGDGRVSSSSSSSPPLSPRLPSRDPGLQGIAVGCLGDRLQASPRAGEHARAPAPGRPEGGLPGEWGAVAVAEGEEGEEEEEEETVVGAPAEETTTAVVGVLSLPVAPLVPVPVRGDGGPA